MERKRQKSIAFHFVRIKEKFVKIQWFFFWVGLGKTRLTFRSCLFGSSRERLHSLWSANEWLRWWAAPRYTQTSFTWRRRGEKWIKGAACSHWYPIASRWRRNLGHCTASSRNRLREKQQKSSTKSLPSKDRQILRKRNPQLKKRKRIQQPVPDGGYSNGRNNFHGWKKKLSVLGTTLMSLLFVSGVEMRGKKTHLLWGVQVWKRIASLGTRHATLTIRVIIFYSRQNLVKLHACWPNANLSTFSFMRLVFSYCAGDVCESELIHRRLGIR